MIDLVENKKPNSTSFVAKHGSTAGGVVERWCNDVVM